MVARIGAAALKRSLPTALADESSELSGEMRELLREMSQWLRLLEQRITSCEARITRRLSTISAADGWPQCGGGSAYRDCAGGHSL